MNGVEETNLNRQLPITPKPLMQLIPTRPIQDTRRPRPNIIQPTNTPRPLLPLIIPQNLLKLRHQLSLPKERPALPDQPRGIDDILREEVDDFEEFVVGFAVVECAFDAVEELAVVVAAHGGGWVVGDDDGGRRTRADLEVVCEGGTTRREGSGVSLSE